MHTSADPLQYMKNMFTVKEPRTLHMRNYQAYLKKAPTIFTTNSTSHQEWLALRKSEGEITKDHLEAMFRRCVFVHVKGKMFTEEQATEKEDLNDEGDELATAEIQRLEEAGNL